MEYLIKKYWTFFCRTLKLTNVLLLCVQIKTSLMRLWYFHSLLSFRAVLKKKLLKIHSNKTNFWKCISSDTVFVGTNKIIKYIPISQWKIAINNIFQFCSEQKQLWETHKPFSKRNRPKKSANPVECIIFRHQVGINDKEFPFCFVFLVFTSAPHSLIGNVFLPQIQSSAFRINGISTLGFFSRGKCGFNILVKSRQIQ